MENTVAASEAKAIRDCPDVIFNSRLLTFSEKLFTSEQNISIISVPFGRTIQQSFCVDQKLTLR